MLRGCQKKIVFLKNTGSKLFDEAYFVISDKVKESAPPDLIKEANRIIEENVLGKEKTYLGDSLIKRLLKNRIVVFFLGAFLSGAIALMITLITK